MTTHPLQIQCDAPYIAFTVDHDIGVRLKLELTGKQEQYGPLNAVP